jgi:hypothetical protein
MAEVFRSAGEERHEQDLDRADLTARRLRPGDAALSVVTGEPANVLPPPRAAIGMKFNSGLVAE